MPSDTWEPRKPPWTATVRRLKRRLKAAASIGIALFAGTFLAFQSSAHADTTVPEKGQRKQKAPPKEKKKKGKVDKEEHRKGMPVPDNLLE